MRHVPVTVLTGAPGAGKTALLQAALGVMPRTAVVVNGSADEETLLQAGGCACCAVRTDLEITLLALLRSASRGEVPAFDRVVVETGGLAEPAPLLQLFASSAALAAAFRMEALVAVIDASRGAESLDREGPAFQQALLADRIVLVKWESMHAQALARFETHLAQLNPHAARVRAARGTGEAAWFAPAEPAAATRVHPASLRSAHDESTECFVLRWDSPQSLSAIGEWLHELAQARGERLLRVRGLVSAEGEARAVAVHAIRHMVAAPVFLERARDTSRVAFTTRGLEPGDVLPPWPVTAESAKEMQPVARAAARR